MYKILMILFLLCIIISILHYRYDPLYPYLNKKRDPENFRNRVFFEKGFWENFKKAKETPFKIIQKINTDTESENIISYSLYGNNPKYYKYLDKNYEYASKYLPDWKIRIYLHNKVDKIYLDNLIKKDIEIYIVEDEEIFPGNSAGAFWRFLPLCEKKNVIILDIDSYLGEDNIAIKVDNFFNINNKKLFKFKSVFPWPGNHIQAQHIYKKKRFEMPFDKYHIMNYFHRSTFGADEIFLSKELYPKLDKNKTERDFRISKYFVRDGYT